MPSSWILARLVREGLAPDSRVPSLREGIVLSDRRWWNLLRLTGLVLVDQLQDRIVGPPSAVFSLLESSILWKHVTFISRDHVPWSAICLSSLTRESPWRNHMGKVYPLSTQEP